MKKQIKVALIGGISLIIGAGIGIIPSLQQTKESNNYLKLINVSLNDSDEVEGIRIIGRVNNDYFTYPMSSFIFDPDKYLPLHPFKLTKIKDDFECYFEVMVLDSTCGFHYLRPLEQFRVSKNSFKYSDVYMIRLIEPNRNKSELECKIEFKIY